MDATSHLPQLARVLIVDDDPPLLGLLSEVLKENGYASDSCQSAQQAIEAVDAEAKRMGPTGWSPWDVLVLDVNLQDMEGFALLEAIRRRPGFHSVPALFMSGARLDDQDIERGLALGALDYLAKPFQNTVFVTKLSNFAELGRFRRMAHQTALALEESEANYRELFENIADAVFVHDFEGRVFDVNEASCSRYGYSRQELIGMNLSNLIAPECCAVLLDSIQLAPNNPPIPFEVEFCARDGRLIPCEVVQRLIARRDRRVIQSVARDITARKKAEEHLRWRNRELAAYYAIARTVGESLDLDHIFISSLRETLEALEAPLGALCLLEDNDRLVVVARHGLSDGLADLVGRVHRDPASPLREFVGSGRVEVLNDLSTVPPALQQAAEQEGIRTLVIAPVRSRGLIQGLLLIAYCEPRTLHNREIEMLRVIGTEIGVALENGRLYTAMMDSERRSRELFEGIGDPVLLHDFSGQLQAVNYAACSLLGFTEEELLGETLDRIGGSSYLREAVLRSSEADDRGRLPLFESVLQTRLGHPLDLEVHARAIISNGQPGILSVLRDISGRKKEERRALAIGSIRGALGRCRTSRDYVHDVLHVLQAFAGCEAVGICLADPEGNVPYVAQAGFPDEFVKTEDGRDLNGGQCLCARVLRGETDPRRLGFTAAGSFHCANLSEYLTTPEAKADNLDRTRCLQAPFESVALVPIHRGGERIGLIHLADTRTGHVSLESVEVLEEIGGIAGMALRQYDLEESLAWETRQTGIGFDLTAGILEGEPIEQAMGHVLDQIADLTGFEVLTIERFHPAQNRLEMWVCRCPGREDTLRGWLVPCDQTLSGRVATCGEMIECMDMELCPESLHPAIRGMSVQNVMGFPIRYRERIVGVLTVAGSRSTRTRRQIVNFLRVIADQLALVISWSDAQMELDRSRRELHSLSARLIQAQEDERARIARELHDSLGQILTSLSIDIDRQAARLTKRETAFTHFLAQLRIHLNEAHTTVRHLTGLLRPGILDDLGLVAALESYLEEFEAHTGIVCRLQNSLGTAALSQDVTVALYRVAQEALTNAARYARARHLDILLSTDGDQRLRMNVRDDGCGFDLASLDWQTSFGLLGMRERLQLVGGQIQIVTQPGAGAEIQASVPMERKPS